MRRWTLIVIILLLALIAGLAVIQIGALVSDERPEAPVPTETPAS